MSVGLQGLVAIACLVAITPFLARLFQGRVPTVALLMLGGIAVGPAGLNWLQPNAATDLLSKIGLGLIFALIGFNIDQGTLRGSAGRLGGLGWLATVAVGVLVAYSLPLGGGLRPVALVIALSSTALSTLVVTLRESGELATPFGRLLLSAGTWGQLAPVLAVALLLSSKAPIATLLSLALVGLVALLLSSASTRLRALRHAPWLAGVVEASPVTPMQLLFLLIIGFIALSASLGVEVLIGSLLAGLVMQSLIDNPKDSTIFKQLEASAYSLFVPLFFVVAGSRLDLVSIMANPWGPFFCLAGTYLIRGLPQLLLYGQALPNGRERFRFSLLVSQSLNLPIIVGFLEVQAGLMTPQVESALVGGSLLSVLLFPALALSFSTNSGPAESAS